MNDSDKKAMIAARHFVNAWLWDCGPYGQERLTQGESWYDNHKVDAAQMIVAFQQKKAKEQPAAENELDVFRALIENRARRFSDRTERVESSIGVKIIKMTGDLITSFILSGNAEGLFDTVFKGLPDDWCVIDIDSRGIFIMPAYDQAGSAGYINVYGVIVGSKEWPVVEGGQLIPEWSVVK